MTTISAATSVAANSLNAARARAEVPAASASEAQPDGDGKDVAGSDRPRTSISPVAAEHGGAVRRAPTVALHMVQPGYFVADAPSASEAGASNAAADQAQARQQYAANLRAVDAGGGKQGSNLKVDL